jgi:hypothetical protein
VTNVQTGLMKTFTNNLFAMEAGTTELCAGHYPISLTIKDTGIETFATPPGREISEKHLNSRYVLAIPFNIVLDIPFPT